MRCASGTSMGKEEDADGLRSARFSGYTVPQIAFRRRPWASPSRFVRAHFSIKGGVAYGRGDRQNSISPSEGFVLRLENIVWPTAKFLAGRPSQSRKSARSFSIIVARASNFTTGAAPADSALPCAPARRKGVSHGSTNTTLPSARSTRRSSRKHVPGRRQYR